jgi:hypothetical protein
MSRKPVSVSDSLSRGLSEMSCLCLQMSLLINYAVKSFVTRQLHAIEASPRAYISRKHKRAVGNEILAWMETATFRRNSASTCKVEV